ncbi:MAG: flagellar hook-length control protein FliK [Rhodospirillaceae bacterium]
MDAINAVTIKTERNPITGSADDFRNVADGFAALVQISGKKTSLDSAKSNAEGELMRLDDNRDLVRDSHKLNDTDADKTDRDDATEGDDNKDDTRKADDSDNEDSDKNTSESSDSETSEDADGTGDDQTAASTDGNGEGQPQVAGDGVGADLSVIAGAAAAAATTQVKTTVEAMVTDTTVDKTVIVATAADTGTTQTGVQSQQQADAGVQQIATAQSTKTETTATPTQTQTVQTAAAANQTQTTSNQTTAAQATPAQTQQGQQVVQERVQNQSTESRSAAAQAQSQDLSKRLGDSTRAQVQVNVTGQQANQTATEPSPFNRFVGYNAGDSRTVSTANGQAGTGNATNAALNNANTPAEKPAVQTTAPIPTSTPQPHTQASQPGTPSGLPRAELSGTPARGDSGLSQAGTGQTNSGATSAPQPAAQATALQSGPSFAQTAQAATGAERPPAPTSSQVVEQIKVNINKGVKAGLDRVTIQLRPENLGKIEVKMELSQDGKVRAFVTAETKETLDLLQRDARGLEKALQDAGLRTDSNNLHFALKSDTPEQNAKNAKDGNGPAANDNADEEADDSLIAEEEYDRAFAAASRGGVDQLV